MGKRKLAYQIEDFDGFCCIKGCEAAIFAVGLCSAHWTRNRRYGSPILLQRPGQYYQRLSAIEAFRRQIKKIENGCWLWTGRKDARGYGRFRRALHGVYHIKAHRWAWAFHNDGPIPDGMVVMHTCDIPGCVNPAHLKLGTQGDNIADMYQKGRAYVLRRTENGRAKLTEGEILAIRASALTQDQLAALYRISQSQISRIISGESWATTKSGD